MADINTSGSIEIIKGILKSTPAAVRKDLSKTLRTDSDLWNCINGFGDVDPGLPKGTIRGIVRSANTLLSNVDIKVTLDGVEQETGTTDANGCFAIMVSAGNYNVEFSKAGYTSEIKEGIPVFSEVESVKNIDLKSV